MPLDYKSHANNQLAYALRVTPGLPAAVQAMFFSDPRYAERMYSNPDLDPAVVDYELTRKAPAHLAEYLVKRPLTPAQMRYVMKRERRIGVITTALRANPPTNVEDVRDYSSLMHSPELLEVVAYGLSFDQTLFDEAGPHFGPYHRILWMVLSTEPRLDLLPETLEALPIDLRRPHLVENALVALFDLHPLALEMAVASPRTDVRLAAAKSINLTDSLASQLLGIPESDLDTRPTPGTVTFKDTVSYYLVRNIVASRRVLDYLKACFGSDSQTAKAVNKHLARFNEKAGLSFSPGLKNLTKPQTDLLLDQLYHESSLGARKARIPHNRIHWGYFLLKNASTGALTPALVDQLMTPALVNRLGPSRSRHLIRSLSRRRYSVSPTVKLIVKGPISVKPNEASIPRLDSEIRRNVLALRAAESLPWNNPLNPRHVGELLIERLGDDLRKWQLFAELSINSSDSSIKSVLGVVDRMTMIGRSR